MLQEEQIGANRSEEKGENGEVNSLTLELGTFEK